jgi:hypothetical protein
LGARHPRRAERRLRDAAPHALRHPFRRRLAVRTPRPRRGDRQPHDRQRWLRAALDP